MKKTKKKDKLFQLLYSNIRVKPLSNCKLSIFIHEIMIEAADSVNLNLLLLMLNVI